MPIDIFFPFSFQYFFQKGPETYTFDMNVTGISLPPPPDYLPNQHGQHFTQHNQGEYLIPDVVHGGIYQDRVRIGNYYIFIMYWYFGRTRY